jgi:cytochrome c5
MRNILTCTLAVIAILTLITFDVSAKTRTYQLPDGVTEFLPGPGQDVAENNCLACHSSDYISTQPRKLGKGFWQAEVTRMRKAFGAEISDDDAKIIVDYLSRTY